MAPTPKQLTYINDLARAWSPTKPPTERRLQRAHDRARRLFQEARLARAIDIETSPEERLGVEIPTDISPDTAEKAQEAFVRAYVQAWRQARITRTRCLLAKKDSLSQKETAELIDLLR